MPSARSGRSSLSTCQPLGRSCRYRRLLDHDDRARQCGRSPEPSARGDDVRLTGGSGRCADADEQNLRTRHGTLRADHEAEAPRRSLLDQLREPGLEEGDAVSKPVDVLCRRRGRPRRDRSSIRLRSEQPDVTGPDDDDSHPEHPPAWVRPRNLLAHGSRVPQVLPPPSAVRFANKSRACTLAARGPPRAQGRDSSWGAPDRRSRRWVIEATFPLDGRSVSGGVGTDRSRPPSRGQGRTAGPTVVSPERVRREVLVGDNEGTTDGLSPARE